MLRVEELEAELDAAQRRRVFALPRSRARRVSAYEPAVQSLAAIRATPSTWTPRSPCADGRRLKMRTRDLSRNGVCLIAAEAVAPGAVAAVDLVLSFGNNAFSEPLVLPARVVWCTQIGDASSWAPCSTR